jgi:mono/diheme cytochrome c family protein
MPGFASSLDDRQIASLAAYVRSRFSRGSAWQDLESHAATIRGEYMRMHR